MKRESIGILVAGCIFAHLHSQAPMQHALSKIPCTTKNQSFTQTKRSSNSALLNEQFYDAMQDFKKRCHNSNSGPLCKIFNEVTYHLNIDQIEEIHVKKMISHFKQDPCISELAEKIKTCLQKDPVIRNDIKICGLKKDKKNCLPFEKQVRAKARQHCGFSCLFNKNQMDTCMAAVFCAAIECLDESICN